MVRIPLLTVATTTSLLTQYYSVSAFVPAAMSQHRHFFFSSSTSSDDNYATPDEIQTLLQNERTVILDVRRADEIQASGYLKTPSNHQWVTIPCTPTDATLLQMTASNLLRDKSAPVLVHCAAGKRAAMAKQVLEEMGYTNVVNAGGFAALESFVEKN
ncbi:hypothetical protein FisN_26Lh015 [Fistulifera solaris]|uniref:Rhodanese domain-containing protein n=1 Tax=Fistulifera solaris TaxID=1519565 RepID=A0A1Z5KDC8_FISSO|nr:hypothetical protein FisN_26Lh015 [Fistulifera solaris]|eukprot:GAX23958.1 hypothetical protein FisN_26Lh015 [Fistulifera solaris]